MVADDSQDLVHRLFRPADRVAALGLAVNYLMTKPAFAALPFGHLARILVGQINREHFYFVLGRADRIDGFIGWALADEANAEAWARGTRGLSFEDSRAGDCFLVNAWAADTPEAHRFLRTEVRNLVQGRKTIYFKRHYKGGGIRPGRVSVNAFVDHHR